MLKALLLIFALTSVAGNAAAVSDSLPLGFDHRLFANRAQALTEEGHTPALALTIVHRGQPKIMDAWGMTDVGPEGSAVSTHTVFRLASGSKGITATAAALAQKSGDISWSEKIFRHVPGAKLSQENATSDLNVFQVLSHQTGIHTYNLGDRSLEKGANLDTIHKGIAQGAMKCRPGQCYSYQNVAFQWAADVIESATEKEFEKYVQEKIFSPLGMDDANFGLEGLKSSPSWARPHIGSGKNMKMVEPKPTYYLLPGAAGANFSVTDMARWLAAQGGYRPDVLPQDLLDVIHQPRVVVPNYNGGWRKDRIIGNWYAMGWRVWNYRGYRVITHAGAVQGYRSFVVLVPSKNLGVGLMWNSQSSKPTQLLPDILDAALSIEVPQEGPRPA